MRFTPATEQDQAEDSRRDHRERKQLPHGQAVPDKAELHIRLAKKLDEEAAQAVPAEKEKKRHAGTDLFPVRQPEQDKKQDPFEQRFVNLARVPRLRARAGENHSPGSVG